MANPPENGTTKEPDDGNVPSNGVKRGGRPNRQQMLLELDMNRQAEELGQQQQTNEYFLYDAYPPSVRAMEELSAMAISELEIETHHRGRVLFVRALDDGARIGPVQTVVRDGAGEVERFAFYNADVGVEAETLLPDGAVFAVKEPYFSGDANGGLGIRVDHPSDLVRLDRDDDRVPVALRDSASESESSKSGKSALEWKGEGNAAYKAGDHRAAAAAYTRAADLCSADEEGLKRDVLRNRAIVNTYLKRYETALEDARAAVIPAGEADDDAARGLNAKAYYRAGRAAYELRRFEEAEGLFQKVQDLTPSDKDAADQTLRSQKRSKERSAGDYDFVAMSGSSNEKHNRLDHADFVAKTEIRETPGRGRGLFATEKLTAGELILCEKAFCVAFQSDKDAARTYTILNPSTKRRSAGTQAILLFKLIQILLYNRERANSFFDLVDGDYSQRLSLAPVDGLVPVDIFRTLGVIDHNSFACPTTRSSSKAAQIQASRPGGYHSTGLWLRASYINHACSGNAMRSFIGDMIIIRASKDIPKGTEILMPYRLPDAKVSVTQADLQKTFAFRCDCAICAAEEASSKSQLDERAETVDKIAAILSAHPLPPRQQPERRTVVQVERLFAKLESTYAEASFAGMPRVGLVAPGLWLCQAYSRTRARDKLIKSSLDVLANMGYVVANEKKTIDVDRTNCQVESAALEAAMHAAHAFFERGEKQKSRQMRDLAESLYLVMNGETVGFNQGFDGP